MFINRKPFIVIVLAILIVLGCLGSAHAGRVFFSQMIVSDCKEFGTCDWKLSCALNNENEAVFFEMVEADSGESIPINRDLEFSSYPVTVHCTVHEHDGGIGAGWEFVGSGMVRIDSAGQYLIKLNNNEGDVTVEFVVDNTGSSSSPLVVADMEYEIDRPGSDYRNFDLEQADPAICQKACSKEAKCKAWTYVKPGIQGPKARCWLKHSVPKATPSQFCISGVKKSLNLNFKR